MPGGEDEFYATITDLLGDKVRYEVVNHQPSVETQFSGALVEAMQACLLPRIRSAQAVPYLVSGGYRREGLGSGRHRMFWLRSASAATRARLLGMFHGVDERVPTDSLEFGARVLDRFLDQA